MSAQRNFLYMLTATIATFLCATHLQAGQVQSVYVEGPSSAGRPRSSSEAQNKQILDLSDYTKTLDKYDVEARAAFNAAKNIGPEDPAFIQNITTCVLAAVKYGAETYPGQRSILPYGTYEAIDAALKKGISNADVQRDLQILAVVTAGVASQSGGHHGDPKLLAAITPALTGDEQQAISAARFALGVNPQPTEQRFRPAHHDAVTIKSKHRYANQYCSALADAGRAGVYKGKSNLTKNLARCACRLFFCMYEHPQALVKTTGGTLTKDEFQEMRKQVPSATRAETEFLSARISKDSPLGECFPLLDNYVWWVKTQ